jgi:hypothetical protein
MKAAHWLVVMMSIAAVGCTAGTDPASNDDVVAEELATAAPLRIDVSDQCTTFTPEASAEGRVRIVQRTSQASHNPGKLTFFAPAGATLLFVHSHSPQHQCFPRLAVHGDEKRPSRWIDASASNPAHGFLAEDRFGGDYTVTLPRSRRPGANLPPAAFAFDPDLALDLDTIGYDIFIDPSLR